MEAPQGRLGGRNNVNASIVADSGRSDRRQGEACVAGGVEDNSGVDAKVWGGRGRMEGVLPKALYAFGQGAWRWWAVGARQFTDPSPKLLALALKVEVKRGALSGSSCAGQNAGARNAHAMRASD